MEVVNIIATDSVYDGEMSALGIRSRQLYELLKGKVSRVWLHVPDLNFKPGFEDFVPYNFRKKEFSVNEDEINILPLNGFSFVDSFSNIIVDGFSPIITEELYLKLGKKEKVERREKIERLFQKAKAILYTTKRQKYFYLGILSWLGLEKPLVYLPLYLPLTRKKFRHKLNKIVLVYGGIYPWVDVERILRVFEKFPEGYKLLFKGVKHPRYKRDKGFEILKKALKN